MNSPKISISLEQRAILEKISRRRTSSVREVERSKIVLELGSGKSSSKISSELGIRWEKVQRMRYRWLSFEGSFAAIGSGGRSKGLKFALEEKIGACLKDAPRPRSPPTFGAAVYCALLSLSVEDPQLSARQISQWTSKELAAELIKRGIVKYISRSQVSSFLKSVRSKTA